MAAEADGPRGAPGELAFGPAKRGEGGVVRYRFTIPEDTRYLEGHFPGDPMLPGVAQVVPLAERQARRAFPDLAAVVGLRRLKFKEALRPGDAEHVLQLARDGAKVSFTIRRGEVLCSQGILVFDGA